MATAVVEFEATGAYVAWVVPAGVTSIVIETYGARGQDSTFYSGGRGGYALGTLAVTAGETLRIYVGERTGFNGGGTSTSFGGVGGGAADVRKTPFALADRKIIGGGGGGGGAYAGGGGGGGTDGELGGNVTLGGGGGTQSAGGAGPGTATDGALGVGGNGASGTSGAGGGGGYYGGGGGASWGGGGGSGYTGGVTSASMQTGVRDGDGLVRFTYTDPRTVQTPTTNLALHSSAAAVDVTATHPAVTVPATQVAAASMVIQRQESIDGTTWQSHGPLGVVGEHDVLVEQWSAIGTFTDWRIANRMNYRYRVVVTGTNGTTATSAWKTNLS